MQSRIKELERMEKVEPLPPEEEVLGRAQGDRLDARVPALGRDVELRVTTLAPLADFATVSGMYAFIVALSTFQ
mgnify:CR=1 FL=1